MKKKEKINLILIGPVSKDVESAKLMFNGVEERCSKRGYVVVHNPMRNHRKGKSEAWYMKRSLSSICDLADKKISNMIAVVLPGALNSAGSRAEVALCYKLGIPPMAFEPTSFYFNVPVYGREVK